MGICPSRRKDEISSVETEESPKGETCGNGIADASQGASSSACGPQATCAPEQELTLPASPCIEKEEQADTSQVSTDASPSRDPLTVAQSPSIEDADGELVANAAPASAEPAIGVSMESTDTGGYDTEATAALVQAVEDEDWPAAEKLLSTSQGIDANARTTDFDYAVLRAAAEGGATATCRLLLDCKADVNGCDKNGMTAIMGCCAGGDNASIVSLLLDRKADASMKTDDGFTALAWATRLKREESIAILRAAGMTGATTAF